MQTVEVKCSFVCVAKKKITRWLEDSYQFYFLMLKTIFFLQRSFIKYCFYHSKIKSISSGGCVIYPLYTEPCIHHSTILLLKLLDTCLQVKELTQNIVEQVTVVEIRFKLMIQCWLKSKMIFVHVVILVVKGTTLHTNIIFHFSAFIAMQVVSSLTVMIRIIIYLNQQWHNIIYFKINGQYLNV